MKKSVIAVLCVTTLFAGILAGCGKSDEKPDTTPETEQEQPTAPSETPTEADASADTENGANLGIPEAKKTDETKKFDITVEGEKQSVEMTKYQLDMQYDGISVEAFIDDALFECFYFEGEYYIVPKNSGENWDTSVGIYYISGKSADVLAEESISQKRDGVTATDEGIIKLGDYDAYCVSFENSAEKVTGNVYYITGDSGTVCASFSINGSSTELVEGIAPRFEAMLQSIIVKKA